MTSLKESPMIDRLFLGAIPICLFLKEGFVTASIVIFLVYCLVKMEKPMDLRNFRPRLLLLPMILMILFVVGTFYADNFAVALDLLVRRSPLLLLPIGFLLLRERVPQKVMNAVPGAFLAACLVASLFCYALAIVNIVTFDSIDYPSDQTNSYFFAYDALTDTIDFEPIYLSIFCSLGFTICLHTTVVRSPVWRGVIACYLGIFIFMVASKIGIIAMISVLVLWLWKRTNRGKVILISLLTLAAIAWVGIYQFPFLKERFKVTTDIPYSEVDSGKWGSTAFRIAIWTCAFEAMAKKPVLGYGTGMGQTALMEVYREKEFIRGYTDGYNAHNEFLSTVLDIGLIGLIGLCAMLYLPFAEFIRSGDKLGVAFMVIALLTFLVESVFFRQQGIVFFAFFYSFFVWRHSIQGGETVATARNEDANA